MESKSKAIPALVLLFGLGACWLLWSQDAPTVRIEEGLMGDARSVHDKDLEPPPAIAPSASGDEGPGRRAQRNTVRAAAPEVDPQPPDSPELGEHALRLLEDSLHGILDPGSILDVAMELAELEPEAQPALESPHVPSTLRYSLSGEPSGMEAEVWIGRSRNPDHPEVLTLRVRVDRPTEPYLLEAAARLRPELGISVYVGPEGNPRNLVILTDFPLSGETTELGLPIDTGRIVKGVHYHLDLEEPSDWRIKALGIEDGSPTSWEIPAAFQGGPWPRMDDIRRFGTAMQGLRDRARPVDKE